MKIALFLAGLFLFSSQAHATKARLTGLAEKFDDGTFLIDDSNSIFRNAAYANDYKNLVVLEWGGSGHSLSGSDTIATPEAEGGFLKEAGNFTYGLYLGRESNVGNMLRILADSTAFGSATTLNHEDNVTYLFFAGGNNIQWGAALKYASYEDKNSSRVISDDSMAVLLGLKGGQWETYINAGVGTEAKDTTSGSERKFDGDLAIHAGGSYQMGMSRAFLSYKSIGWKFDSASTTTLFDGDFAAIDLGYGVEKKVGMGTLYASVRYNNIDIEQKLTSVTATFKRSIVPIYVAYEMNATSWLRLRGGIKQNLMGTYEQNKLTNLAAAGVSPWAAYLLAEEYGGGGQATGTYTDGKFDFKNSTDVNAGATLVFNRVEVDGVLGVAGSTKGGKFNFNNFMTRVGMTYKF